MSVPFDGTAPDKQSLDGSRPTVPSPGGDDITALVDVLAGMVQGASRTAFPLTDGTSDAVRFRPAPVAMALPVESLSEVMRNPASLLASLPAIEPVTLPTMAGSVPTELLPTWRGTVGRSGAVAPGLPEPSGPAPTRPALIAFDAHRVRRDFPALNQQINGYPIVWLDNAATTQKPQAVIDAIARFYSSDNSNVHRGAHTLAARSTDDYEWGRSQVRRLLNAASDEEVVFVRGTTEGLNLIANTWGQHTVSSGDVILVTELEHHSNIVPWQMLAARTGAILRAIPIDDSGEVRMDMFQSMLDSRVRILSVSQVSNALGTVVPVAQMARMAHHVGATVVVDGAQGVPHLKVDVRQLGADFYVFSGHKLFGPTGIGAVYGRRELLESMPPWQGGGSMIKHVAFDSTTYADIPMKFEAGTPNIAGAYGLGVAIEYLERTMTDAARSYDHDLLLYMREGLLTVSGLRLIGSAAEMLGSQSLVLDDIPATEVGHQLDRRGIAVRAGHHCAQPTLAHFGLESTVRPSLAFYNTREDVDRLVSALDSIVRTNRLRGGLK
ncbi:MAG TPA: SufS family cysteine desulfurase [Acidimicrobiales bacterium]|jgi:cysteine desulfurase/selenocysteine lyase|nr:SufS family cysteine desulfurase [Acidimicrobiales bacterium]